jgi:hypothetical protein
MSNRGCRAHCLPRLGECAERRLIAFGIDQPALVERVPKLVGDDLMKCDVEQGVHGLTVELEFPDLVLDRILELRMGGEDQ